jgi:hypothetical protein
LLTIVSWPVAAPAVAESNWTTNVSTWPGLSVTGRGAGDSVKPTPVSAAEFIVTGAVPTGVKVTD